MNWVNFYKCKYFYRPNNNSKQCTNKNQIPNMMDDSGNVRAICVAYTSFIILAI